MKMQKTQNSQNYFEKNKVEDLFMYRMTQYCLDINYPHKLLYRFYTISVKILEGQKKTLTILKYIWKFKKPKIVETIYVYYVKHYLVMNGS